MPTYLYQNRATLIKVANTLVLGLNDANPIYKYLFPIRLRNSLAIRWTIKDNYKGLMSLRGAGGAPISVNPEGDTTFETEPGVFGNFMTIDEIALLKLGALAVNAGGDIIDVRDEIAEKQAKLTTMYENRMRQMSYTLALTGTLSIALPGGSIGYRESYTPQTFTASPLWSSKTTAHPVADFMQLQQSFGVGTSNKFDNTAVAIMNSYTASLIWTNTNAADWGGKRTNGGGTVQGMGYYNALRMDLMLPEIIINDDGYLDDSGTFQLDVPNGKIIVIAGRADGEEPGEFSLTYNAVSKAPGAYSHVADFTQDDNAKEVPPRLEVHQGFNGGNCLFRASQIVIMTVA